MRDDRSWMYLPRWLPDFENGVTEFLNASFSKTNLGGQIRCPCKRCKNRYWLRRHEVFDHLKAFGFVESYDLWIFHGEDPSSLESTEIEDDRSNFNDNTNELLEDRFRNAFEQSTNVQNGPNDEAKKFYRLVEEGKQELYPGCKTFSKLSFIIRLFLYKTLHGISNVAFNDLLELLKEMVPDVKLPANFNEAKNVVRDLGLDYKKIYACPNDCMLYWKEYENAEECHICHASKWKQSDDEQSVGSKTSRRIPAKVLWYFPLKPRLQRLYMCSETAEQMTWHANKRPKDGYLRHPADGLAWKQFDSLYPSFASESDEDDEPLNNDVVRKVTLTGSRKQVRYIPPRSTRKYSSISEKGLRSNNCDRANYSMQVPHSNQIDKERLSHERQEAEDGCLRQRNKGNNLTMADLLLQKQDIRKEKEVSINKKVQLSHLFTDIQSKCTNLKRQKSSVDNQPTGKDVSTRSTNVSFGEHYQTHRDIQQNDCMIEEDDMLSNSEGERSFSYNDQSLTNFAEDNVEPETQHVDYDSEHVDLDTHDLALDAVLEEKTRGPTMLHHVHMRPLEKRKAIVLNEFGQPVGPITEDEDTVGEFSRFLGTIARDYSYAPLVFQSWRNVPNKERMWEYVQMKYIVPDEGKDWVLKTIAAAWRAHKCRFKKKHYYAYKDDKARWKNRSKRVPEDDFVKLLATWKKKTEKMRCSRNRDHRLAQKNMHTAGPKSFATIREEMKNAHPNKEPPSLAELFERTRKRSEGKHYKQSYEDTAKKIDEMQNYTCSSDGCDQSDAFLGVMGDNYDGRLRLYGRGVCKKKLKKVNGTSYVVPGEVIESVKASLYQDMRKDMDSDISRIEEVRRLMDEEHLKKKEELEAMKQDLLIEKESMTEQVMQKILEKLPLDVAKK